MPAPAALAGVISTCSNRQRRGASRRTSGRGRAVRPERARPPDPHGSGLPRYAGPPGRDPAPDWSVKAPDQRADPPGVEPLVGTRLPSPASLWADRDAWHHYLHRVSVVGAKIRTRSRQASHNASPGTQQAHYDAVHPARRWSRPATGGVPLEPARPEPRVRHLAQWRSAGARDPRPLSPLRPRDRRRRWQSGDRWPDRVR